MRKSTRYGVGNTDRPCCEIPCDVHVQFGERSSTGRPLRWGMYDLACKKTRAHTFSSLSVSACGYVLEKDPVVAGANVCDVLQVSAIDTYMTTVDRRLSSLVAADTYTTMRNKAHELVPCRRLRCSVAGRIVVCCRSSHAVFFPYIVWVLKQPCHSDFDLPM